MQLLPTDPHGKIRHGGGPDTIPERKEMIETIIRGPVNETEIELAEASVGQPFPEPFRSWLAATGGGSVRPELDMPRPHDAGILSEFLSPDEIASLRGNGFSVAVPARYLVVADVGSGGAIAVVLEGADRGHVYWADYDKHQDLFDAGTVNEDESTERIMSELAPDWDEFLASR